ncbi:MAG: hypothetical protein Q7T07_16885 [Burkholderiaceae bacterium]|nr:hypothetical protein [Burkholderiaceae bacterium]
MYPAIPEPTTLAHLHDRAKAEASRLRGEAVDDFWRGANAVWQRGLHSGEALAQRSAARLRASLARHARSRNAAATPQTPTGV